MCEQGRVAALNASDGASMTTTTISTTQPYGTGIPGEPKNYLNETTGIWSWMSTLDHKRIGLMYLFGVLFAFFLGGMFAMLVRTEHLTPGATIFTNGDQYNQMFTLHG